MRAAVLCLALASFGASADNSCPAAEYAQYKDRAATKEGRQKLSLDYCMYRTLADANRVTPIRGMATCEQEAIRILDALNASGDLEAIARAKAGCPDVVKPK